MEYFVEGLTTQQMVPMTPSHIGTFTPVPLPATLSALVVERTLQEALSLAALLTASHFHVTVAETFPKAKASLGAHAPALLITEVRLAEYNGLHLVLRAKSVAPAMAAVVLSGVADRVLQADAELLGATFVVKPVSQAELTAAVFRTIFNSRRGDREPVRAPFERRQGERRAAARAVSPERRSIDRRRDLDTLIRVAASV